MAKNDEKRNYNSNQITYCHLFRYIYLIQYHIWQKMTRNEIQTKSDHILLSIFILSDSWEFVLRHNICSITFIIGVWIFMIFSRNYCYWRYNFVIVGKLPWVTEIKRYWTQWIQCECLVLLQQCQNSDMEFRFSSHLCHIAAYS